MLDPFYVSQSFILILLPFSTICCSSIGYNKTLHTKVNPLKPGVTFLHPLIFSGGKEKQHQAVMG